MDDLGVPNVRAWFVGKKCVLTALHRNGIAVMPVRFLDDRERAEVERICLESSREDGYKATLFWDWKPRRCREIAPAAK